MMLQLLLLIFEMLLLLLVLWLFIILILLFIVGCAVPRGVSDVVVAAVGNDVVVLAFDTAMLVFF